jgi:integrase
MARRRKSCLPKYVIADRDRHGNVRLYFRHPSLKWKIRLRSAFGTAEFEQEYRRALQEATGAKENAEKSLDWLCDRYCKSSKFKAFEENTKRRKRAELETICNIEFGEGRAKKRLGSLPFTRMSKAVVIKLRDMKDQEDLHGAANYRVKQIRALYSWAIMADLATLNPATSVEKIQYASGGFYTWTEADLAVFERKYPIGTRERLAMAIMLYLGARRSDAARLGPQNENADGTLITFLVFKNRKRKPTTLTLPILPPLRKIIDATEIDETAYLLTSHGKPHGSEKSFGNWFSDICDRAGLPQCTSHGLRKIAAVHCAEAGATLHEMMAMFGWHDINQALVYTQAAEQKKMAASAARKMINVPPNVPPVRKARKINRIAPKWRSLGESNPSFKIENLAS